MTGPGAVLALADVKERRAPEDTAAERGAFAVGEGDRRLEQRLVRCAPGRSRPREVGDGEEVLYVLRGEIVLSGTASSLAADEGLKKAYLGR